MNEKFLKSLRALANERESPVPTDSWRNALLARCREGKKEMSFFEFASFAFPRMALGAVCAACLVVSMQRAVPTSDDDVLDDLFTEVEYFEEFL